MSLEERIAQLTAALEANTKALLANQSSPSAAKTDKPKAPPKADPAPAPAEEDDTPDAAALNGETDLLNDGPSEEEVKALRSKLKDSLNDLIKVKGRETALKVLTKYGAKTIGDVPADKLEEAIKLAVKVKG